MNNNETSIFLNHHNLIKSKYSITNFDQKPQTSPKHLPKPLFLTTVSLKNPKNRHKSFSLSSFLDPNKPLTNQNPNKLVHTLTSFHNQILFQRTRQKSLHVNLTNSANNDHFVNNTNNANIANNSLSKTTKKVGNYQEKSKLLTHSFSSNKKIQSKLDSKHQKRGSLLDICEIISLKSPDNSPNKVSSHILRDFLDPKLDLRKFSIKKAELNLIDLTKPGKIRSKLQIIPINNEEFPLKNNEICIDPLQEFLQKSLKGNRNTKEIEETAIVHKEIWTDFESLKEKLYRKLNEKPLKKIEENSIFKFSEKTIIGIGREKIEKMKEVFDKGENTIDFANYEQIGDPKLTYQELNLVKEQFLCRPERRNHKFIDVLLRKLKYFQKIPKFFRFSMIKNAEFTHFPMNTIIVNEENLRKSLFIIIKGSVNIRGKYVHRSIESDIVLTSLYDGEFFGDFSNEFVWNFGSKPRKGLLNIKNPYVETCEESYFLVIPLEISQVLVKNLIKKELDQKLRILDEIAIFKEDDIMNLFPLASQFVMRKYKLGEVVIREGEWIENFFVVANGRCAVIYKEENNEGKEKEKGKNKKEIISKGKYKEKKVEKKRENLQEKRRIFPEDSKHEVIRTFQEKDFFGERALLTTEDLESKSQKFSENCMGKTAKLTVVSDREETLLLELERKSFLMLPMELQIRIRSRLIEVMEFDQMDIEKLKVEMKNWEKLRKLMTIRKKN